METKVIQSCRCMLPQRFRVLLILQFYRNRGNVSLFFTQSGKKKKWKWLVYCHCQNVNSLCSSFVSQSVMQSVSQSDKQSDGWPVGQLGNHPVYPLVCWLTASHDLANRKITHFPWLKADWINNCWLSYLFSRKYSPCDSDGGKCICIGHINRALKTFTTRWMNVSH